MEGRKGYKVDGTTNKALNKMVDLKEILVITSNVMDYMIQLKDKDVRLNENVTLSCLNGIRVKLIQWVYNG